MDSRSLYMTIAGLVQQLLHVTLDKTNAVRCSNWEARPLSDVQKMYAATDAFAALAVYQVCGCSMHAHAGDTARYGKANCTVQEVIHASCKQISCLL